MHLRRMAQFVLNKMKVLVLVIQNMNVLHDMFPNLYDLSKEDDKNRNISGDKETKSFCFVIILSPTWAALLVL